MFSNTKAALTRQLAFSLMLLSVVISCKDSSVGSGFVEESVIVVDTIYVSNFPMQSADAYSGKLSYSPVGKFDDPLFGELESFAFFRPDIDNSDSDSVLNESTILKLRLYVYQTIQYGDTLDNPSFSIYRVGSPWRGAAYKMSDEITLQDQVNKVGSFTLSEVDTTGFIDVELTGTWKEDYKTFYNNEEDDRDTTYQDNDFGLALLPDDGAERIVYLGLGSSSLMVFEPDTSSDTLYQAMLDWGFDFSRENETVADDHISLFSTLERFYTLDFTDEVSNLVNSNFVRAELVLTEDSLSMQESLEANEVRNEDLVMSLRLSSAVDIAYDLAFNSASSSGGYDSGDYRFNLTTLFNANIFGSTDIDNIYLYAHPSGGILGFNTFFGPTADKRDAPKLLIYRLESEE